MKSKRLISILLLLVMLLSLLPVQAFATSEVITTVVENGLELTLYSDGTLTAAKTDKENDDGWFDRYLVTRIVIEDGVTEIPAYAFQDCTGAAEISMPDSVKTIGDYAFSWCNNVSCLDLPSNLQTIGANAFRNMYELQSIVFPSKVKSIGDEAFAGCSINKIYFEGNAPTISATAFKDVHKNWSDPAAAYYPKGNSTWTSGKRAQYGGNLKWRSISKPDEPEIFSTGYYSSGKPIIYWEGIPGTEFYTIYRSTKISSGYKKIASVEPYDEKGGYCYFEDETAKAGTRYYYKIKATVTGSSKYSSGYSNVVDRCCDLPMPQIQLSNTNSTGKVKLTWDKIKGAQKYYIYRGTNLSNMKKVATTTKNYYTDNEASIGKDYYYAVQAVHAKSSANSAYTEIQWGARVLPCPNVTAKISSGKPRLSWEKISGATKYTVYRARTKNGEYDKIKTITSTAFTDSSAKAGVTYYYKVIAIHKTGANSMFSSPDKAKVPK